MVHWAWAVGALFVGVFLGVVITALCVVAKNGDIALEVDWPEYPR